jgi:hypothetical protein
MIAHCGIEFLLKQAQHHYIHRLAVAQRMPSQFALGLCPQAFEKGDDGVVPRVGRADDLPYPSSVKRRGDLGERRPGGRPSPELPLEEGMT